MKNFARLFVLASTMLTIFQPHQGAMAAPNASSTANPVLNLPSILQEGPINNCPPPVVCLVTSDRKSTAEAK